MLNPMKLSHNTFPVLLLCIAMLTLAGCYKASVPTKASGFIGDYHKLKPMNEDGQTLFYLNPNADWSRYHSVVILPVSIHYIKEGEARKLDKEDVDKMGDYFRNEMTQAIKGRFGVVSDQGPRVLVIRTSISDVKPTNVIANIVSKSLIWIPVDMGEAAIEGDIRDSMTGEVLAAIVDRKVGSFFSTSLGYTTWGHVKDGFEEWAKQLRIVMRGKNPFLEK